MPDATLPPARSKHEIPLKSEPTKKFNIQWELAYPNVNFKYPVVKDDKTSNFVGQLEFHCLLEKFGIPKDENESKNANELIKTLLNCFKENKVTLEPWQTKYYAIEFKGEEDKTLFKVFLKDD